MHDLLHMPRAQFVNEINTNLETKAAAFFQGNPPTFPIPPLTNLDQLLDGNFIVMENHNDLAARKFLIQNMRVLAWAGFTKFFTEHGHYDIPTCTFKDPQEKNPLRFMYMPPELCKLEFQNKATSIVTAARKHNIQPFALETGDCYRLYKDQLLYERPNAELFKKRRETMNYAAYYIIQRESALNPQGKWFALMGAAHAKTLEGVTGLCELTGARAVFVTDTETPSSYNIKLEDDLLTETLHVNANISINYFAKAPTLRLPGPVWPRYSPSIWGGHI